ncbi:MAG: electron transfer flavoprotein subunit beta/FixA family protein [bacterium]|nr:electron transfer flavoprotein subunit beta/FixA family protein [bacterium]
MRVVVCLKHVPDTNEPKRYDPETRTLVREGLQSIINPMDDYALEQVLQWKDSNPDLEIVTVTVGPEAARDTIKKALAKGADRAVLVTDSRLAGSDYLGVARALAAAIQQIGEVDVLVAGVRSSDSDTYQTAPATAELLGWPQVTLGKQASLQTEDRTVVVERDVEGAVEVLTVGMPALVTIGKIATEPRLPSFKGIMAANKKELKALSLDDLGLAADQVGAAGACTRVVSILDPEPRPAAMTLTGAAGEVSRKLVEYLHGEKLV